ncbi:39S ribosomal protein L21, mitochondrial [Aplysia californica]|uniref:Large ribosomal subunit protein bL21m n=1 Tax=Aplysia californica TaxID=6500 RepID=A0ABM1ADI4_APLCA|nr:39S ribosomal protein L21, mitochondrial [Aplysia californica]
MKSTHLADTKTSRYLGVAGIEEAEDFTPLSDKDLQTSVSNDINTTLEKGEMGRLFAIVYIRGMQYKVTPEDIIVVKNDFPPNVGDKIRLEKVMAVGGRDFSLFGQPLLSRSVVKVEATVVEKTLTHNRVWYVFTRKKNTKTFHLYRERQTMLVINSIQVAQLPQEEEEGGKE